MKRISNRLIAAVAVAFAGSGMSACADSRAVKAPPSIPTPIIERINANKKVFLADLDAVLAADANRLLTLVDKTHSLSADYEPEGLVPLGSARSYVAGREGLSLRAPAEAALEEMAKAARKDGVTLVVSSTYRSLAYQKKVYERNVLELGQEAADRESARPGTSQHHLGTAVDFGSITDDYALTKAGRWLAANAGRFGWSLSFPQGYEKVTGYRWECWHYRYVGREAAAFQAAWFDGVQQYMIEFIAAWKDQNGGR